MEDIVQLELVVQESDNYSGFVYLQQLEIGRFVDQVLEFFRYFELFYKCILAAKQSLVLRNKFMKCV